MNSMSILIVREMLVTDAITIDWKGVLKAAEERERISQARVERLEEALQRIVQWADAYPLDVFLEPDFKKVSKVLKASGLSLDQVSASNMRHVVKGVGNIARAAVNGSEVK